MRSWLCSPPCRCWTEPENAASCDHLAPSIDPTVRIGLLRRWDDLGTVCRICGCVRCSWPDTATLRAGAAPVQQNRPGTRQITANVQTFSSGIVFGRYGNAEFNKEKRTLHFVLTGRGLHTG